MQTNNLPANQSGQPNPLPATQNNADLVRQQSGLAGGQQGGGMPVVPPVNAVSQQNAPVYLQPVPVDHRMRGLLIFVLIILFIAGSVIYAGTGPHNVQSSIWAWSGIALLLTLFLLVIGGFVNKARFLGILIDSRNKMTVARLQLLTWNILKLSSWGAIVLWNIANTRNDAQFDPLNVAIPFEVWGLIGISVTSFAASSIILSTKKAPTDALTVDNNQNGAPVKTAGVLDVNTRSDDASLTDMIKGDDAGNCNSVDLSKVQMIYFTFMIVLTYTLQIANMILSAAPGTHFFDHLPGLNQSMVALLGISHSGYLVYKAVPHKDTSSDPQSN